MSVVELRDLQFVGSGLRRPECVLCTSDGSLYASNWDGGVTRVAANGAQSQLVAKDPPITLKPNGIALCSDSSFLLANLGDDGGIWRLDTQGACSPVVTSIDGEELPPCNFVTTDVDGRTWFTVSTRQRPRHRAWRADVADGFVAVADRKGARIVADGLGYTNEIQFHPSGDWLYINETFARRLSRCRLTGNGGLGKRETVIEFGEGVFPDGLCFDEAGGIWIVSIVSNQVIRIDANGAEEFIISDSDPEHVSAVEKAYLSREMQPEHLGNVGQSQLRNVSSIAFGGPGRRRSYLGCLLGDRIVSFEAPVRGIKPIHWDWCAAEWR